MPLRSCKWIFIYCHIDTLKLPFINKSIMIYAYKDILKCIKAHKSKLIHQCLSSRIYILIIGSMHKRVHILTHLSPHKNTTRLTSIDMQVQISEYIGHPGLNLP